MVDVVILTVLYVAALFLGVIYYYMGNRQSTTIPGPNPTSERDGNLADIAKAGSLHEYLLDLHQKYGDIAAFRMGKEMVVSICSPELFREHSNVFDRPASLYKIFEPLLGRKSIPFANKAEGKSRRKNYNLALGSSYLHCYYPGIQALSGNLVHDWSNLAEMETIPLNDSMITFGIKLAIVSMFGSDSCSDEAIKDIRHNFLLASNELERKLIGISDEDSERVKTFEDARNRFHDHVNKLVTKRREHRKKTDTTLLVDVLIDSTNDEEEILHDAVTFTAAGSHTTGSLLTWVLYFLSTNPDVQENVYTEIDQVIGTSDVDPRSAKDLKYLHKVINETIRCAVIIPWTARYQDNDSELGGYKIPAKTSVIHALGASLQSEKYFLNPKRFDPDRFSEANIKSRPAYAFQPFGFAGKRMCPGYNLAITGAIALLVNILKIFRVKLVEGQMVTPKFGIGTHPKDKIWITVEKR